MTSASSRAVVEQPAPWPSHIRAARAPWWERNIQFLLPLPTIVLLLLFVVYPTITAVQFSLNHVTITGEALSMRFSGLDNYASGGWRDAR